MPTGKNTIRINANISKELWEEIQQINKEYLKSKSTGDLLEKIFLLFKTWYYQKKRNGEIIIPKKGDE